MKSHFLFMIIIILILAACGGDATPAPPIAPTLAAQILPTDTVAPPSHTPSPVAPTAAATATQPPPSATAVSTAAPAPSATPNPDYPVAIVLQTANLRSGPGLDFPIIGPIGSGQEVRVSAATPDGEWNQLEMEGEGQVWIAAFLLRQPATTDLPIAENIPAPPLPPTPGDFVRLGQTTISIPTYPWREFSDPTFDPAYDWEYWLFNRTAYESANPQPSPQAYTLLTMDNQWLHLSLMPELGGRLYQMLFKPTGNNELYQNPVIKPSPWGPGPEGNGWLAAGGIEWGLPVVGHGYAWNQTWGYITTPDNPAASTTVFDQGQERLHLSIDVGMQPDSAAFTLDFRLENNGQDAVDANFWSNAMLAPGPANRVGPDLRFLFPGAQMTVHSTGESDLPGAGGVFDWPVHNGRDVSRLGTWNRWLGFFANPQTAMSWSAVYDAAADEGVVRVFPTQYVPGVKGFGLGWGEPLPANLYTDDGSSYVEMQGGIRPGFDSARPLQPDETLAWRETWYPVAGIGGVSAADAMGAAHLLRDAAGLRLRLFPTRTLQGDLVITGGGAEIFSQSVSTNPAQPLDISLADAVGPIGFRLTADDGRRWEMTNLNLP